MCFVVSKLTTNKKTFDKPKMTWSKVQTTKTTNLVYMMLIKNI